MQYTDKQLLDRVVSNAQGFTNWPKAMLDVWVRSTKTDNLFDEKVYTFDCTSGTPVFKMVCTGTSNAGTKGLQHPGNPNGCAVLQSDRIVYDSHVPGLHKGEYPAYVQSKAFPFYRDNNRNVHAEEIGQLYFTPVIGANCHHAGVDSTFIENWSEGCLVRNVLAQFNNWMLLMHKRGLTVCILKEF